VSKTTANKICALSASVLQFPAQRWLWLAPEETRPKVAQKTSRNRPEQEGPCSLNTAINRKLLFWSGGPGGC
jgi:hypothetical protein